MYLLDTNVISETRRLRPHGAVRAWLTSVSDKDLHLAAVTIGEMQIGIERTRDLDPARAKELEVWLQRVTQTYNILPMDATICRRWAKLMHRQPKDVIIDAMIAATAAELGFTVVTRNTSDFSRFDIPLINPFIT